MKILHSLIALSLLSLTSSAFADSTSQDITRLNYYPYPGKFLVTPDVNYSPTSLNVSQLGTSPGNTNVAHTWDADFNFIYGLPIQGLRFNVTESLEWHHWSDSTNPNTGVQSQTNSSGFSDPTLELQYRVFAAEPYGLSGDIDVITSPSLVSHDIATSSVDGNDGKGYGTLGLTAALFWITPLNDARLALNLTHDFSGQGIDSSAPASSYVRSSVTTYSATLGDRFHFTRDGYAQLSGTMNFGYSYNQFSQSSSTYTYPFRISPTVLLGYRVRENLALEGIWEYEHYRYDSAVSSPTPQNNENLLIQDVIELRAVWEI